MRRRCLASIFDFSFQTEVFVGDMAEHLLEAEVAKLHGFLSIQTSPLKDVAFKVIVSLVLKSAPL